MNRWGPLPFLDNACVPIPFLFVTTPDDFISPHVRNRMHLSRTRSSMPLNGSSNTTRSGFLIMARKKSATRCAENGASPNRMSSAQSTGFAKPCFVLHSLVLSGILRGVKAGFSSDSNQRKYVSTVTSVSYFKGGVPRKVSAQALSKVRRMERLRGKKAWISGETWPIRD